MKYIEYDKRPPLPWACKSSRGYQAVMEYLGHQATGCVCDGTGIYPAPHDEIQARACECESGTELLEDVRAYALERQLDRQLDQIVEMHIERLLDAVRGLISRDRSDNGR